MTLEAAARLPKEDTPGSFWIRRIRTIHLAAPNRLKKSRLREIPKAA
jgi:hypothetical protein